ncbi:MAG: hypothetical protein NT027_05435 [Proteobacteria bacterium]|nr:hypothetical protein [Pseudomonadota bacterium]
MLRIHFNRWVGASSLGSKFGFAFVALVFQIPFAAKSNPAISAPANSRPLSIKETHPFQEQLICKRPGGSFLLGQMYSVANGKETLLSTFNMGSVGACEFAIRNSRNGMVCIEKSYSFEVIDLVTRKTVKPFGKKFEDCLAYAKNSGPLKVENGYVQFIDDRELSLSLKNLPSVNDPSIDGILHDPKTMWYDEASMIFSYQDSFGNPEGPEGLRANRVGYDVGSTNSVPDIRALTEYFDFGKFKFPFAIAAGGHDKSNVYVLNFWSAPRDESGAVLPVVWWKSGSHWHWTFPVGTTIGELLLIRDDSQSEMFAFEVRSRTRHLDGWKTDIFRPFTAATDFANAIKDARPNWQNTDLLQLVNHLEDSSNLVPAKLETKPYKAIFPTVNGFYDVMPGTSDTDMIKSFLKTRVFQSAMNKVWKENGAGRTYAANTNAGFHIVPQGFIAGLLESSEASCQRCHNQAGRPLGQLDGRVVLYGEIWGEDEIFTWHPFKPIVDMFSVSDGSRIVNPKMEAAGLVQQRKPQSGERFYKEIVRPYPAKY